MILFPGCLLIKQSPHLSRVSLIFAEFPEMGSFAAIGKALSGLHICGRGICRLAEVIFITRHCSSLVQNHHQTLDSIFSQNFFRYVHNISCSSNLPFTQQFAKHTDLHDVLTFPWLYLFPFQFCCFCHRSRTLDPFVVQKKQIF